jgi:hypothetical protein
MKRYELSSWVEPFMKSFIITNAKDSRKEWSGAGLKRALESAINSDPDQVDEIWTSVFAFCWGVGASLTFRSANKLITMFFLPAGWKSRVHAWPEAGAPSFNYGIGKTVREAYLIGGGSTPAVLAGSPFIMDEIFQIVSQWSDHSVHRIIESFQSWMAPGGRIILWTRQACRDSERKQDIYV